MKNPMNDAGEYCADGSPILVRVGSVYIARTAVVVGDVTMGPECNIWPFSLIRGDVAPIRMGARVNIQDGSILHCNKNVTLEIEDDVATGHGAIVHCRRVGRRTLIASRATVLDDCEIGADCLIAAGAVVPPRTIIPDGSLVMGIPGRVVRPIGDKERNYIRRVVETYLDLSRRHVAGEFRPYTGAATPGAGG